MEVVLISSLLTTFILVLIVWATLMKNNKTVRVALLGMLVPLSVAGALVTWYVYAATSKDPNTKTEKEIVKQAVLNVVV